jgi:hypothetical protein
VWKGGVRSQARIVCTLIALYYGIDETAQRILTEERERLLEHIQHNDLNSVRDLSRRVERDVSSSAEISMSCSKQK